MKNPASKIADLRARVANQIEELGAIMTHLREAHDDVRHNPRGAAMCLAEAGTELFTLHDACAALAKVSFDLKTALEKK